MRDAGGANAAGVMPGPADWQVRKIVARLPHLWRISVASHSTALAMVNSRRDGFGLYQYSFISP
jgi:hypothetical protein